MFFTLRRVTSFWESVLGAEVRYSEEHEALRYLGKHPETRFGWLSRPLPLRRLAWQSQSQVKLNLQTLKVRRDPLVSIETAGLFSVRQPWEPCLMDGLKATPKLKEKEGPPAVSPMSDNPS